MSTLLSAAAWAGIWGVCGALFGYSETGKQFSWLIGIPICLPALVVVWGTIRGTARSQIPGAFCGAAFGAGLGFLGFVVFQMIGAQVNGLVFRDVPAWWTPTTIYMIAGLLAGGLIGGIAG